MNFLLLFIKKLFQSKTILIGFLLFLCFALCKMYSTQKQAHQQLIDNWTDLQQSVQQLQLSGNQTAAQNKVILLQQATFFKFFPKIKAELQHLKIPPQRVVQYQKTAMETLTQITTHLKDSVLFDTIPIKVFHYQDAYERINGLLVKNEEQFNIQHFDTLIQVVFKGKRKRPLFWIFSKRMLQQRAFLSNPHAQLQYAQTLQIQSRK